ncbi:MAG: DUF3343 domain-containing protein [Clostridia bacterium]|nr:DUF3343 domain-containing protein [Clostridia bacterium]
MEEQFGIAAFRSRQQVMAFEKALQQSGVRARIVSTPRAVAAGCGLSVRFEREDVQAAAEVWRGVRTGNLIGFYEVQRDGGGRLTVRPMGIEAGYSG